MKIEILDNADLVLVDDVAKAFMRGAPMAITLQSDELSQYFVLACNRVRDETRALSPRTKEAAKLVALGAPPISEELVSRVNGVVTPPPAEVPTDAKEVVEAVVETAEGDAVSGVAIPKVVGIEASKSKRGGRGKKKDIVEPDPPEASPPPEPEVLDTPPVAENMAQLKKELTKVFFQLLHSPNGKRAALEIGKKYNIPQAVSTISDEVVLPCLQEINERLNGHA